MLIDLVEVAKTPLLGGVLIGLAAVILVLMNGKIAGISGIFGRLLIRESKRESKIDAWRAFFIGGLLIAPFIYAQFAPLPEITFSKPWFWYAFAGFLVGIGTRMGSGCTSGHGIYGLSRGSKRSLVALLTFMGAAFLVVFIANHLL